MSRLRRTSRGSERFTSISSQAPSVDKRVPEKWAVSRKSFHHMDNYSNTSAPQRRGYRASNTSSKIEADRWGTLPERGTSGSLQVIAWIAVRLGPRVARLLLYPITVYFLITADAARRASYEFLKRAHGRSVRWHHVFRHLHCFATTILDRFYMLRGEFERFCVTIEGKDVLKRQMETG